METYSWIIENKEIIKIIYAIIILFICVNITFKSHKILKLSEYQGIRYFRNAFFFFGIAFIFRYFFGSNLFSFQHYSSIISILFSFFFIMAGFSLVYSLLWKKIDSSKPPLHSLFNPKIFIFYFMALILVLLDYFWGGLYFLFGSQILIFLFAFAISLHNYSNNGKNAKFLKFYALAMFLSLIAWILNGLAGLHLGTNSTILIYLLNIFMFLLFLFGMRVTKK